MSFSVWLLEELKARNMSQRQLAESAGIAQGHLSNVLAGKRALTADIAIQVARALDVSPILVLIIADILPPETPETPGPIPEITPISELISIARRLPPDQLRELIDYAYFKLSRR